jgi:hypothetical protein
MTFEPHGVPALNVEDDAVSIVERRFDGFLAGFSGQFEEVVPIKFV